MSEPVDPAGGVEPVFGVAPGLGRGPVEVIYGRTGTGKTMTTLAMVKAMQEKGMTSVVSLEKSGKRWVGADVGAGVILPELPPLDDKTMAELMARQLQHSRQRREAQERLEAAHSRLAQAQTRAAKLENALLDLAEALEADNE